MLVRKQNGSVFHIVSGENWKYFYCLCGERVLKNYLELQAYADGTYTRCLACRKLETERLKARHLKVYQLVDTDRPLLRNVHPKKK